MELAINNHKLDIYIGLMVKNEGLWAYGICIDGSSPVIMALEAFYELARHDPQGTSDWRMVAYTDLALHK